MSARLEHAHTANADPAPERGPRILFFSGGTALRPLCRTLKRHTHNSIHLVTPFDSGGSSGLLRRAFGMPGIGDLRNRLLALADEEVEGNAEVYRLLSHRFDRARENAQLEEQLDAMIGGHDPLVAAVKTAVRDYTRSRLRVFSAHAPRGFDLRGASIGNLVLTGAWLESGDLAASVRAFSELLCVRGVVHATVEADVHLAVRLEDGRRVVGQHQITGKDGPPLSSPIRDAWLVENHRADARARVEAPGHVLDAIRSADLICFPMGSFFSSVLCNLLPTGVGRAVAEAPCQKVYVPNTGHDPEQRGINAAAATRLLLEVLRRDAGPEVETRRLLDFALLDPEDEAYAEVPDATAISRLGVEPLTVPLCQVDNGQVDNVTAPDISPVRLARTLLTLAAGQWRNTTLPRTRG